MELVGLPVLVRLSPEGNVLFDAEWMKGRVEFRYPSDGDPWGLAASLNLHRRHDTTEERLDHARRLAESNRGMFARQVARQAGVSPTTAAKIVKKAEESAGVSTMDTSTRTDTLGRQQPAAKTAKPPGTGNNEWFTPPEIIAAARAVLGDIDLDAASCEKAQKIVQAADYFTAESDGLAQEWHGRVWLNPPYSRDLLPAFVDKLLAELDAGRVTEAIMLVNNCTDAAWFHAAKRKCAHLLFSSGRIRFLRPDGLTSGAPTQGKSFLLWPERRRLHRGVS
jgi:phage N-6-adenine-methyltransferase